MNKIERNFEIPQDNIKREKRKRLSKQAKKGKRKLSFKQVFKYILLFIALCFVLYNNIYQFSSDRSIFKKNIFNVKLYHVTEKTMEEALIKGDVSVISTRKKKYKIDDILYIVDQSGPKLERVVDIVENELDDLKNIEKKYITKSDNSYYLNNFVIEEDMIIGKQIFKIPKAGTLLEIARSRTTTIIMIIILVIILFLLLQIKFYRPARSVDTEGDISFVKKIKLVFSKENRRKSRKAKHSRKTQKEITKKRLKARKRRKE